MTSTQALAPRGLFYCAVETCSLGPEIWREGFGLCWKHALECGFCEAPAAPSKPARRKRLLDELLEEIKNAPPPLKKYWWEDDDDLPF